MGINCSFNNWKKGYKNELNNMWQSLKNEHILHWRTKFLEQYCSVCEEQYPLICQCSRKRYIDSITYDQLQEF